MSEYWEFLKEVYDFDSLPEENLPEFIFWGRSNVGKSSLINSLTKSKIARTSKTPGRTRSLVFFELANKLRIVDFPGYGYSKIPKNSEFKLDKLIELYLLKRRIVKILFLLIDSRHGFKKTDQTIIHQLNSLLDDRICIVFTKIDKLKNSNERNSLQNFNNITTNEFNKKFFNASIKETNTIILLKKFILNSLRS
ncbi:MAG: ribosome biogenesis GTP-binding protein YihA/YsxC [Pseudomonadota bacterium]|nr:ribosome biogenesis GTP-binding protein YihA/YsxC [Pseudomonadota bacterium]